MNKFTVCIITALLISIQSFAQDKNAKDYKEEVKATILEFFDGFHKGDTAKMKKTIDPQMVLKTVVKDKEGNIRTAQMDIDKFLGAIQNRPAEQKWDERLLSFTIEADGSIANAWTPYEFYLNDNFSHCGVNVFQLYHDGSSWRIMTIADTRKREGCN